jgi:hypothetical protein
MITRTVHVGEATVTLQRETRRVALNRARYLKALEANYPMLKDVAATWFIDEKDTLRRELISNALSFAQVMAQTISAVNSPVKMPSGVQEMLPDEDVRAAFEHFLDDDTGFWNALIDASYEMNVPLTPAAERPDVALTEEQAADPNS